MRNTNNAVRRRVALDDLELDGPHASTNEKQVALADGPVRLEEVRLEVSVEQVAGDALDSVVNGKDVHALAVLDVSARVNGNNVSETDAQVVADDLVDANLGLLNVVVGENNQHGVAALLALDEHGVAAEETELLHGGSVHGKNRVVVVGGIVDNELVGRRLFPKDGKRGRVLGVRVRKVGRVDLPDFGAEGPG